MSDQSYGVTPSGRPLFDNTATVVCVLFSAEPDTVLCVQRGNNPGKGKYGLPGGYHMYGESWQEAGCRELLEETGYIIFPEQLKLMNFETDEYNNNNVLIALHHGVAGFRRDQATTPEEVMSLKNATLNDVIDMDWAFPMHKKWAIRAVTDI